MKTVKVVYQVHDIFENGVSEYDCVILYNDKLSDRHIKVSVKVGNLSDLEHRLMEFLGELVFSNEDFNIKFYKL